MKKILILSLVLLVSITAIGCTKRDPNQGRSVPKGEQVNLQVWTAQEPEFIKAVVREFISSSGETGIVPKVISFKDDQELQSLLLEKMAEGAGPDVIFTEGAWLSQNPRKLSRLESDDSFSAAAFENTFLKAATDILIKDQSILGVPLAVDTLGVIYNEDHLVDRLENRNSPALTWAEFRQDMSLLTQENNSFERFEYSGAALGRTDNTAHGFDLLVNLMLQSGTRLFTNDGLQATFASDRGQDANGKTTKAGVSATEIFTSFADPRYKNYSWNQQLTQNHPETQDFGTFASGKTSMVFGYARDLSQIEELAAKQPNGISVESIKTAPLPQITASGNKSALAQVYAFGVPKTAKYPEISWKFVKFTAEKDIQSSFFGNTGLPSARLDLIAEQTNVPNLGSFVRQAKFAESLLYPMKRDLIKDEFTALITDLNSGRSTASNLINKLETTINQALTLYWQREKEMTPLVSEK